MLPGGPLRPVDPRNERGVGIGRTRSTTIGNDSGLLRRFVIARNPESVACTTGVEPRLGRLRQ